jgi:hypothetical protein
MITLEFMMLPLLCLSLKLAFKLFKWIKNDRRGWPTLLDC